MRRKVAGGESPAITQGDARHRAMTSFVPPYPDRPARPLSVFSGMRKARQNFLSIWPDE